ncbi:glycosyltransferase family 4 protein [Pseudocolwellia sp. HL-MZ19]|uniref:glycosyltransferase family 4 protein n=1 Tax=Pseudocolwellia sp. HL-MZ19 TaxID=3400846 RepID=UPI003CE74309
MDINEKILVDGRLLSVNPTGISRYCVKMIGVIAQKYGEKSIVVLVNDAEVMQQDDLLKRLTVKETKLQAFNLLHWILLSFIVFFQKPKAYICLNYSGLCFKRPSLKLVVTVYDLMFAFVKGFFGGGLKDLAGRLYYGVMVPRAIKISDVTLTISEASKQDIKNLYKKEAINMSGGNFLEATPEKGIIGKYKLIDKSYFMYAGNNRPHKNLSQLLRVFSEYKLQHPEAILIIVGHKGVSSNGIIYPGFVSEGELVALYQSAKALVFPSIYEGFGLPVLEAIINGCPVIASDIPAFREFENKNMVFFSTDKQLYDFLNESPIYNKEYLKDITTKFSWKNFSINLEKI